MKRLIGALLLVLLAACGDIPQPFRHEGINAAMAPRVARGVVVQPLDDGPRARQLADAMVRKLLEADIPASIREVVPGAPVISGKALPASGGAAIAWRLSRPDGEVLGEVEQLVPATVWSKASPKAIGLVAAEAVDKLSEFLHGEAADNLSAGPLPTVRLMPLSGLPGDGDAALTTAMRRLLLKGGMKPAEGEADFVVRGQAGVTPGKPGEEMLAVSWTVSNRKGEDLGSAAQQGAVPKGRLSGPWGSLATDIAAGGVDGVVEIVRAALGK